MKTVATICGSTKTINCPGSYQMKVGQNLRNKTYKTLLKLINIAKVAINPILNI